jgi:hypothetical protein
MLLSVVGLLERTSPLPDHSPARATGINDPPRLTRTSQQIPPRADGSAYRRPYRHAAHYVP